MHRQVLCVAASLLTIAAAAPGCTPCGTPRCTQRSSPRSSPPTLSSSGDALAKLGWLSGSWVFRKGKRTSEEHWTHAAGGTLLGVNRTVVGNRTVHYEQLRLEQRATGIFYVASPKGQKTTAFRLVRNVRTGNGYTAVFENLQHDFPTRIIYTRSGFTMQVRIEGKHGKRSALWTWRRARLPAD